MKRLANCGIVNLYIHDGDHKVAVAKKEIDAFDGDQWTPNKAEAMRYLALTDFTQAEKEAIMDIQLEDLKITIEYACRDSHGEWEESKTFKF